MLKIVFIFLPLLVFCSEKPRIFELIPGMEKSSSPLLIEPALPDDFIAFQTGEDLFSNEIIWGRCATIEKFKMALEEDRADIALKELKSPVIVLFLTTKKEDLDSENFIVRKSIWNHKQNCYPVLEIEGSDDQGNQIHTAYVDLSETDSYIMQFNFIYPQSRDKPTTEELTLWRDFIDKTETLPERAYLEGHGIELYKGYTIYSQPGGIKVKFIAEKKRSTGQFRIKAEPLNEETFVSIQSTQEEVLVTEWHNGEPSVTILCNIRAGNTILTPRISVAYKLVDEFSIN